MVYYIISLLFLFFKIIFCCSFDDVTDGKLNAVLEQMKSQPMLQTYASRNHIGCARKIGIKIVENRKFIRKKQNNALEKPSVVFY